MTRLMVVGASGLLGGEAVLAGVQLGCDVVAVSGQSVLREPTGVAAVVADMASPGVAEEVIRSARPTWVVNAAAAVDLDALEDDPVRASRLNATMPALLAETARSVGARFVHISTDAVFDGAARLPYTETDLPSPLNVYGASKLTGEQGVREANPAALTVRTTIYGWNATNKKSLAEWFLARLEAAEPVAGFTDAWFTPINTADLIEEAFALLRRPVWPPRSAVGGVLHLAGGDCITKFEFGRRIAMTFGHDPRLVQPGTMGDSRFRARRSGRACLDSTRGASELGRRAPSVEDGLRRFRDDLQTGRRDALRRMGGCE